MADNGHILANAPLGELILTQGFSFTELLKGFFNPLLKWQNPPATNWYAFLPGGRSDGLKIPNLNSFCKEIRVVILMDFESYQLWLKSVVFNFQVLLPKRVSRGRL